MASKKTTPAQADKMVKKWQALLGLHHWRVVVEFVESEELPEDHGGSGMVVCQHQYLKAWMTLAIHNTPEDVEVTVIHEFCHILHARVEGTAHSAMEELSPQSRVLMKDVLKDACDAMSVQLQRAFTRIETGKDGK